MPMRAVVVKDEKVNPCKTPEAQQQKWRRHFLEILNLQNEFSLDKLELVRQRQVRVNLIEPPSEEELERAIAKLCSRQVESLEGRQVESLEGRQVESLEGRQVESLEFFQK